MLTCLHKTLHPLSALGVANRLVLEDAVERERGSARLLQKTTL
jgi:hypothetical protein